MAIATPRCQHPVTTGHHHGVDHTPRLDGRDAFPTAIGDIVIRHCGNRTLGMTLAVLALLGGGCRTTTASDLDPGLAAGTYVLEAPAERGPSTGTFVLTRDGQVTRRVQYPARGGAPSDERTFTGTFRLVRSDLIVFMLSENATPAWRIDAVREGTRFTLRTPHPADGEVVEIYRRVGP